MGFALTKMTFTDITSYWAGYVPSFYFGRQMFYKIIDVELLPHFCLQVFKPPTCTTARQQPI